MKEIPVIVLSDDDSGEKKQIRPTETTKQRMKKASLIVLSDDDDDEPVETKAKEHNTLLKKGRIGNNTDGYMSFLANKKVSAITNKKPVGKEFQNIEYLTFWDELADQTGIDLNDSDIYSVRSVSDGDEAGNGTHKNTNKRKANAIPDMIPSNAKPLVDLSIRHAGRPVTRQPMTQDMRNEILNSKKQAVTHPRQVNDPENTFQQVTDPIQPSKRPRGRPRIGELPTCNAEKPVHSTPRKTGRPTTRQPMTQDMRNEILNSKKPAIRPPRQVNNTENNLQKDTDAIQPSKKTRGRPRIGELPTCNAGQSVDSTPRGRGRPRKYEISTGATTSKQGTLNRGNLTLVGSDMHNLKGKMVTRQSLRKMNSTQPQRKGVKNAQRHGFVGISKDYLDHGDPTFPCESCGALLWHAETLRRATGALNQSYSICCSRGKVKLGTELKEPPKLLKDLITNEYNKSAAFIDNIRHYNSMFAFTSMGGKVDDTVNYRRGPFCYHIHGENYHRVGSLLLGTDKTPKFAQLYIFDTENEITNRIKAV
ncbi:reverse transcriptase domain-containing protein, partial [Tanacetum coccineum]